MRFIRELIGIALYEPMRLLVQVGICLVILAVGVVVYKIYDNTIHKFVTVLLKKTNSKIFACLGEAFRKPVKTFILMLCVYIAVTSFITASYLEYPLTALQIFLTKAMRIITIAVLVWGFVNSSEGIVNTVSGFQNKLDFNMNKTVTTFLAKIFKAVIIAFGGVIIISELGYDVNGLIAGIGLGGLTVALAAQDTASNFFAGLMIILDKPFSVDDWIQTPNIEGIVEDISFRSTRVRTFGDALVVIPNSQLANQPITNWSKMNKRRVIFNIGLAYKTPKEKIILVVEEIRQAIAQHKDTEKDKIVIALSELAASSLNISVQFFTTPTALDEYTQIKEDINYQIIDIVHKNGVEFAFPSTSVYIENE
ncbi:MAG: mechanosensitive ion channel family protein [Oscillospiraceae bacterium]